jgi:alpha-D-ribose 1-methylphosphonate 5-triphosphate synthase subunit PhnH
VNTHLEPGFADPVNNAQQSFRAILDAMSHPGRITRVACVAPPAPLGAAAGAALLTLVDQETPLWLDPDARPTKQWIEFHCGARIVTDLEFCAFALALSLPDVDKLPAGSHEAPEASATIICQVASLDTGRAFRLSGPGLREPASLAVKGLPNDFPAIWRKNRARFPCGIDLILCAGDRMTALPRTVSIEEC